MNPIFQGSLLVAAPSVIDEPFSRTVILILQHSSEGTFGVVLNRPAQHEFKHVWQNVTGRQLVGTERFSMGGPMGGPIFALHQNEPLSEAPVTDGVFLSVEAKVLNQLVRQESESYRIFVGMSGWKVGQLETEMQQGKWILLPPDSVDIFQESDSLWENLLQQEGRRTWQRVVKIDALPASPELN